MYECYDGIVLNWIQKNDVKIKNKIKLLTLLHIMAGRELMRVRLLGFRVEKSGGWDIIRTLPTSFFENVITMLNVAATRTTRIIITRGGPYERGGGVMRWKLDRWNIIIITLRRRASAAPHHILPISIHNLPPIPVRVLDGWLFACMRVYNVVALNYIDVVALRYYNAQSRRRQIHYTYVCSSWSMDNPKIAPFRAPGRYHVRNSNNHNNIIHASYHRCVIYPIRARRRRLSKVETLTVAKHSDHIYRLRGS